MQLLRWAKMGFGKKQRARMIIRRGEKLNTIMFAGSNACQLKVTCRTIFTQKSENTIKDQTVDRADVMWKINKTIREVARQL
jgi:hypothetical protein